MKFVLYRDPSFAKRMQTGKVGFEMPSGWLWKDFLPMPGFLVAGIPGEGESISECEIDLDLILSQMTDLHQANPTRHPTNLLIEAVTTSESVFDRKGVQQ